jgi:TolB-like protein/Flp pilus assembly protein TadD
MDTESSKSFWRQLRDRKVIRVGVVYILVGWVLMQIGEVTFEALGLPDWALTLLIVLVLLGFPLALVLSWAFEVTPGGIRKDSAGATMAKSGEPPAFDLSAPSIAVLPFEDLSEQGNHAYFCEGIAEEILNSLCRIPKLRVAARLAAFQCSRSEISLADIGSRLHVQTVLEGSVRKSDDQLRITAQLVKTADGYHLWSRQYDRRMEDIFQIQAEIAESIARTLSVTLGQKHREVPQPADTRAYDFFLRGQSYFGRQTLQDTIYARQMFERALEIDPEYGRAWAGLAYTYGFEQLYFNASHVNRHEALRTSRRALKLAPQLAESHVSAGLAHCMVQAYDAADAAFTKATDLDSENFEAWYFHARSKVHEGELEQAIRLFERAADVRREDYQSVLLMQQLYHSLGDRKHELQMAEKGLRRARAMLRIQPDDTRALNMGAFALARLGRKAEGMEWMQASLLQAPADPVVNYNSACFYALNGEPEKALDVLEDCVLKVGILNREWLEHDSDLDGIRGHPRYARVLSTFSEAPLPERKRHQPPPPPPPPPPPAEPPPPDPERDPGAAEADAMAEEKV